VDAQSFQHIVVTFPGKPDSGQPFPGFVRPEP